MVPHIHPRHAFKQPATRAAAHTQSPWEHFFFSLSRESAIMDPLRSTTTTASPHHGHPALLPLFLLLFAKYPEFPCTSVSFSSLVFLSLLLDPQTSPHGRALSDRNSQGTSTHLQDDLSLITQYFASPGTWSSVNTICVNRPTIHV